MAYVSGKRLVTDKCVRTVLVFGELGADGAGDDAIFAWRER